MNLETGREEETNPLCGVRVSLRTADGVYSPTLFLRTTILPFTRSRRASPSGVEVPVTGSFTPAASDLTITLLIEIALPHTPVHAIANAIAPKTKHRYTHKEFSLFRFPELCREDYVEVNLKSEL